MAGLSTFAILLATQKALMNVTDIGSNVSIAPKEYVKILVPNIYVYALSGALNPEGMNIADAEGSMTMCVEIFVPPECKIGDGSNLIDCASSASAELVLSAIYNDTIRTLMTSPSPWAVLWRKFVMRVTKVEFKTNVYQDKQGGQVSTRGLYFHLEPLAEPITGLPVSAIWKDFINQLEADAVANSDAESLILATYLKDKIQTNIAGPWQVVAAGTGIGVDQLAMIGTGPLPGILQTPHHGKIEVGEKHHEHHD